MHRILAAVAVLMTVACNNPPSQPHVVSNPGQTASDLHCSLPIRTPTRAGFIDFPSARFRPDPTAPADKLVRIAYAFGAHTWVKSSFELLSPDGKSFVEEDPIQHTQVDIVDAATLQSKPVGKLPGVSRLIAFRSAGIYLANTHVYRMDAGTGEVTKVGPNDAGSRQLGNGFWQWVTLGDAWFSLFAGPNQADGNSVRSLSLADGNLTTWYTAPATRTVSIIGFITPTEPLVVEFNTYDPQMANLSFMDLIAPGQVRSLSLDRSVAAVAVTDTMGVWLDSPGHVWLFTHSKLVPMADVTSSVGSETPAVDGTCR